VEASPGYENHEASHVCELTARNDELIDTNVTLTKIPDVIEETLHEMTEVIVLAEVNQSEHVSGIEMALDESNQMIEATNTIEMNEPPQQDDEVIDEVHDSVVISIVEADRNDGIANHQSTTGYKTESINTVRNLIMAGNLIRVALFPQKVGGSTKNGTLFRLVKSFH
jgi:hypothetical protein